MTGFIDLMHDIFPLVDAMGGKEKENHDSSGRRSKGGETAMRVFS